ncbi:hypothetical protein EV426DRAFT_714802 [Tirmania nivea]|nr:hypothetical protein EV426DRAFT_714802 [Tirmania nivea]
MSTSATPTPKPHKPPSGDASNPFGSPLHRRPFAVPGFAFDLESLQQYKGTSPVKTPGAIASPGRQKPTVEGKKMQMKEEFTANTSLRRRHGNASKEGERNRERDAQSPSRPQLQQRGEKLHARASGMGIFGPAKTLRRTPPQQSLPQPQTKESSPTPVRSFGKPRSPNILSPALKAASTKNVDLGHREGEQGDLVAALLERKRVLEGECHAMKRKREELELEKKEEEEGQRKRMKLAAVSDGDVAMSMEGLGALIQSLLAANDSNLIAPKPPKVAISTADAIPSARPLQPPSDPSHPLYRTLCPFTFTSHTITLVPSTDYPSTDPPTTITHHTLRGHTPHHLLSFRFEFDVARTTVAGASSSTIIDLSTTAVSSHAQPELRDIFAVARARRDLLLAMTALGEYTCLAAIRAEGWRVLARAYEGIVSTPQRRRLRKGLGSGKRMRRRLDLLSHMGQREMWFRSGEAGSGQEQGPEEMCLSWEIEFERTTGMGRSKVGVEVEVPGERGKKMGGEVAMVGGLKGEVERVFGELVRERGVVGAVRAIVGVVFGVDGVWEEGEQEEEEEEQEGRKQGMGMGSSELGF